MKFYHREIELEVPDSVYYPMEDSLLIAKVIENLDLQGKKCLEMGCGSGFLSIVMAQKGAVVTAADVNEAAIEAAKKNAKHNKADIKFLRSDLFEKIKDKFDLIVFNPPYLPVDVTEEKYADESFAGGKAGRETIEKFIREAKHYLHANGKIILLFSSLTGEKEILDFAEKCSFKGRVLQREKLDWEEIMVMLLEAESQAFRKEL